MDGDYALDVVNPDDGVLSLREAVLAASTSEGPDVIQFAESLANTTIQLDAALGSLVIDSELDIQGSGAGATNCGGPGPFADTVFWIDSGVTTTLSGLTITQGSGGIYNAGTLTVTNSIISGNSGADFGGGIRMPKAALPSPTRRSPPTGRGSTEVR